MRRIKGHTKLAGEEGQGKGGGGGGGNLKGTLEGGRKW